MANKYSLGEKWREARNTDGGYIWKKDASGKVVPVPVYDEETDEDERALKQVASNLESFVEEEGILERGGLEKQKTNKNSVLNMIITRTVENPKVASTLESIKQETGEPWHRDPDCILSIARIIKKNYAQYNFTEKQLTDAIGDLYVG